MIRTTKVPFLESRASGPVLVMTAAVMAIGLALPFTSVGTYLGLQALPGAFLAWLAAVLVGYAVLTQLIKAYYIKRFSTWL